MVHYLRQKNGKTIVDADATKDDLSVTVDIRTYSEFLLISNRKVEVIADFDRIQELRGEYHETMHNLSPDELAKKVLTAMAKKYDLDYVTD